MSAGTLDRDDAPAGSRPPRIGRLVLLGHPVAHSLSPAFQNAALRARGIALEYAARDVPPAALDATLADLAAHHGAGNVTVPHKERVAERCARRSAIAERVGAVNTFWHDDGALVGDNTDVGGFDAVARALLGAAPRSLDVALLGAGGSAAAVIAAVEGWSGCRVRVWGRTMDRARALAARFADVAEPVRSVDAAVDGAALVVNATPVGLQDDALVVAPARLAAGAAVFDLVYRRGETPWARACRAAGHAACDGLPMLIEQGALSFTRWFGVAPDREAMWAAVGGRPPATATDAAAQERW